MLTLSVPEFLRARDSFQVGQVVQVHGYFGHLGYCFSEPDVPTPECLPFAVLTQEWHPRQAPNTPSRSPSVFFEGSPSGKPYTFLDGLLVDDDVPLGENTLQYGREYLLEMEVFLDESTFEQTIPSFRYRSHKPLRSLDEEGPIELGISHFVTALALGLPDRFQLWGVVAQVETCEESKEETCVPSFSLHQGPLPYGIPPEQLNHQFPFSDALCSYVSRYLRGFWGKQNPLEEFGVGAEVVLDLSRVQASACPTKLDRPLESFEYLGHRLAQPGK
jgi:hypothetical protein